MRTVDVVTWMATSFRTSDFVVLKMDVEGAEYPIFEKLALPSASHCNESTISEALISDAGVQLPSDPRLANLACRICSIPTFLPNMPPPNTAPPPNRPHGAHSKQSERFFQNL